LVSHATAGPKGLESGLAEPADDLDGESALFFWYRHPQGAQSALAARQRLVENRRQQDAILGDRQEIVYPPREPPKTHNGHVLPQRPFGICSHGRGSPFFAAGDGRKLAMEAVDYGWRSVEVPDADTRSAWLAGGM